MKPSRPPVQQLEYSERVPFEILKMLVFSVTVVVAVIDIIDKFLQGPLASWQ